MQRWYGQTGENFFNGLSRWAAYCEGQSGPCSLNHVWTAKACVNSKDLWVQLNENSHLFSCSHFFPLVNFGIWDGEYLDVSFKKKSKYTLNSLWEYDHNALYIHRNSLLNTKCFHTYYFICPTQQLPEVNGDRYYQPYFPEEKKLKFGKVKYLVLNCTGDTSLVLQLQDQNFILYPLPNLKYTLTWKKHYRGFVINKWGLLPNFRARNSIEAGPESRSNSFNKYSLSAFLCQTVFQEQKKNWIWPNPHSSPTKNPPAYLWWWYTSHAKARMNDGDVMFH